MNAPKIARALVIFLFLLAGQACSTGSGGGASDDAGNRPGDEGTGGTGEGLYVALGDSFAAVAIDASGASADPVCGRSPDTYPNLVADHAGLRLTSVACAGATVVHVTEQSQHDGVPRQLDAVSALPDAEVVTITIGGNDIGFGPVVADCVSSLQPCDGAHAAVSARIKALEPRLSALVDAVRAAGPGARIFVVGYPHLVADPDAVDVSSCAGVTGPTVTRRITVEEARFMRAAADDLAEAMRRATEATDGARFLDARATFDGHEVCAADPWISGVNLRAPGSSFHPMVEGQRALASLVLDALAS